MKARITLKTNKIIEIEITDDKSFLRRIQESMNNKRLFAYDNQFVNPEMIESFEIIDKPIYVPPDETKKLTDREIQLAMQPGIIEMEKRKEVQERLLAEQRMNITFRRK